MTVQELRDKGYKVRVLHNRYRVKPIWSDKKVPQPCGGSTLVRVTSPNGQNYEGYAQCSHEDNYNKKLGVKIALGRALKDVEVI